MSYIKCRFENIIYQNPEDRTSDAGNSALWKVNYACMC